MKVNCVENTLSNLFTKIAFTSADHPFLYIIIPVLISCGLTPGLFLIETVNDIEYLFPPLNTRGYTDRKIIERLFPMNYSHDFEVGRVIKYQGMGKIIVVPKDGKSVLRPEIFRELKTLNSMIYDLTVTNGEKEYQYQDICARDLNMDCYKNSILDLGKKIEEIRNGTYKVEFPLELNNQTWTFKIFGNAFGGVELDEGGKYLVDAKASALNYFLDSSTPEYKDINSRWEDNFLEMALNIRMEHVDVYPFVSKTLEIEFGNDTLHSMRYFIITVIIMLFFAVVSSLMADAVRSKPWIGILGCISSTLSVGASMGLCVICGMEFITINYVIPFIMLGIGLDDTFVLLSAWRRTSHETPIKERLASTFRHAGVSITITSVTNLTSFLVGSITPFRAANILCSYMSVAVVAAYVYQITFFAGSLALLAHAERDNRHSLLFFKVLPKSKSKHMGIFYQKFVAGGVDPSDPRNPEDNGEHSVMLFFRDKLGRFMCRPRVKVAIIFVFGVYLAGGLYGITKFREGLEMYQVFSQDSYAYRFAQMEQKYFYKYLFRAQMVIYETLDYSDISVQENLENLVKFLESKPFVGKGYLTESWIRYFKMFLEDKRSFFWTRRYNLTNKIDFIKCLRNVFFKYPPAKRFIKDVVFNENYTDIVASRLIFQAVDLKDSVMAKNALLDVWDIFSQAPFDILVYHPFFLLVTMFVNVMAFMLQAITITSGIMMGITFLFIPNITVVVCVAFSLISIEMGVMGYMTLWGVNLNPTSLVCLIICIGFSVDNASHIAFAFVSSHGDGNEKMRSALYYVGMPIMQATISTVIGVMILPITPSYNFHVFFKTITLVMIFAASHSLILFPVLLSLFDSMCNGPSLKESLDHHPEQVVKLVPSKHHREGTIVSKQDDSLKRCPLKSGDNAKMGSL